MIKYQSLLLSVEVNKMKKEKLFFQFYKAINLCFTPGADKHSYKRSNETKVKIFSYSDRRNIIKVADQLSKFIEKNYHEIIYIKDIGTDQIQAFFQEKSLYCTRNTLMNYKYCIRKLEKMVKQELHLNINYINGVIIKSNNNTILRDVELSQNHLEIILKDSEVSKSKAVIAIKIAAVFGLRVGEVCKLKGMDIDIEKGVLHIVDSKGKRSRDIKIFTSQQLEICNYIKNTVKENERVCSLRENSVNAYLRRALLKNNITLYQEKKTGVHALRKHYAKRDYLNNLDKTKSKEKAWSQTSLNLGHSSNRKVLMNTYVKY